VRSEPQRQEFQPNSTFSTWIGALLLFAFFGLLALVIMNASPRGSEYEEKRARARMEKLQAMQKETTKALTSYAWVDKSKGTARIPISEAMKRTVAELGIKKPTSAYPIATPAVSAAPQSATAPSSSGSPVPAGPSTTAATPPPAPGKSR
jgi:hypothetical protein